MPSKSKQQQKFMGIVRAIQKGDEPASKFSKDAQDAADDMKKKDVEDFASTKHKGLPKKVEQALREKIRTMVEDYVESCGYVVSAKDPNYKLKSPGGTGEEDKELKENAGVPNKMRAGFKKLKNKEGLSQEERNELYKAYKGIVELLTYGNFYDNKKPNKRRKELSELTFDINYALVGSKRLGSYQGRFEAIFKKFLNMINTQIKREEKGLKTDYRKAMRASKLDDVKNIFKNMTKYARTQKGIEKGTNENAATYTNVSKQSGMFKESVKESTIQEQTVTPINKIKGIKNLVKKDLVSYRGTGAGGNFEISIRNKKVPGYPPSFALLQKDEKKYRDIRGKQFKIKPVAKYFIKGSDLNQLKKFGNVGFLATNRRESVDEALTGGDRKVLMVIGREIKDNILKKHPNVKGQQLMKVISNVFMSMSFTPDNQNYKNFKKYFPKRYNDKLVKRLGDRLASENDRVRQTFFKKVVGESVNESYTLYHKGRPVTGFYTNAFPITKVVGTSTRSYISFKSEKEIKDDFKRVLSDVSKDDRFTKQDVQKLATMFKRMKIRKNESVNEARLDPKQLLQQLGGNRFIMMVGAKNLVVDKSKNELHMKIGRNSKGVSHVVIKLTSLDLYDMKFLQMRKNKIKVKSTEKGVYADQLGKMFKKNTGMNVRL